MTTLLGNCRENAQLVSRYTYSANFDCFGNHVGSATLRRAALCITKGSNATLRDIGITTLQIHNLQYSRKAKRCFWKECAGNWVRSWWWMANDKSEAHAFGEAWGWTSILECAWRGFGTQIYTMWMDLTQTRSSPTTYYRLVRLGGINAFRKTPYKYGIGRPLPCCVLWSHLVGLISSLLPPFLVRIVVIRP